MQAGRQNRIQNCIEDNVKDPVCKRVLTKAASFQSAMNKALKAKTAAEKHANDLQAELNSLETELIKEQDNCNISSENLRQQLESQILEFTSRLDETDNVTLHQIPKFTHNNYFAEIHESSKIGTRVQTVISNPGVSNMLDSSFFMISIFYRLYSKQFCTVGLPNYLIVIWSVWKR